VISDVEMYQKHHPSVLGDRKDGSPEVQPVVALASGVWEGHR
jgi:hypothetical protein